MATQTTVLEWISCKVMDGTSSLAALRELRQRELPSRAGYDQVDPPDLAAPR